MLLFEHYEHLCGIVLNAFGRIMIETMCCRAVYTSKMYSNKCLHPCTTVYTVIHGCSIFTVLELCLWKHEGTALCIYLLHLLQTYLAMPLHKGAWRCWLWRAPRRKQPHLAGWDTPGPAEENKTTSVYPYSSMLSSLNAPEMPPKYSGSSRNKVLLFVS